MQLTELLDQIDEIELADGRADDVEVREVTFDSRHVEPGALFVALRGSRVDGHDFVADAVEAGASALLVEDVAVVSGQRCPVLAAPDTRRVLGRVAEVFYDHPSRDLNVIGITGTNGKTTTAWVLAALLEHSGQRSGLVGTIAHRWGGHAEEAVNTTPESLVLQQLLAHMREDGVRGVAMEVSSHGLATHRLVGTHFDAAVFTNLSRDHLDFHGDMASYRDAKARLFVDLLPASKRAGKDPVAVINADDKTGQWLVEEARGAGIRCVTYGLEASADYRARVLDEQLEGTRFQTATPAGDFEAVSPLLGRFNVANALAAVAVALELGSSVEQVQAGLEALPHVPGRMQRVDSEQGPTVFVDYAHSPDALERALETLSPLTEGRLWVVFGCGGDRDRQKRGPMGGVAADRADVVIVTSDNPRSEDPEAIIEAVVEGIEPTARAEVSVEVERGVAIDRAVAEADREDVVLVAGKGHEGYQEIGGERVPFDDVERVRGALQERGD